MHLAASLAVPGARRPTVGRWRGTRADFFTAGGLDPLEQGFDDPSVHGWRWDTVAEAQAVMAAVEEYAARCAGQHEDAEGHTATLTRLEDPAHGDEAVALAVTVTWPGGGGHESLDLLVRDGRSISRVLVRRSDGPPSAEPAAALSRVAWRRIR